MTSQRIFHSADFLHPADGEPIRSVVTETPEAVVVVWHVKPGQRIAAHIHPYGQDTWTVLSGEGEYQLDAERTSHPISAGDIVIAPPGSVHGVYNNGAQPLIFIAVVSPAEAGYHAL